MGKLPEASRIPQVGDKKYADHRGSDEETSSRWSVPKTGPVWKFTTKASHCVVVLLPAKRFALFAMLRIGFFHPENRSRLGERITRPVSGIFS